MHKQKKCHCGYNGLMIIIFLSFEFHQTTNQTGKQTFKQKMQTHTKKKNSKQIYIQKNTRVKSIWMEIGTF